MTTEGDGPVAASEAKRLGVTDWLCAMLAFAVFGLMVEIIFTGIGAGFDGSFRGQVSLLMIPVYAAAFVVVGPLLGALERTGRASWRVRIPLTVVVVYAFEWSFGAAYRSVGLSPWHYDHGWASDFSGGNITLYYLPAWIVFAVIVLPAWRVARAVGPSLSRALRDGGSAAGGPA